MVIILQDNLRVRFSDETATFYGLRDFENQEIPFAAQDNLGRLYVLRASYFSGSGFDVRKNSSCVYAGDNDKIHRMEIISMITENIRCIPVYKLNFEIDTDIVTLCLRELNPLEYVGEISSGKTYSSILRKIRYFDDTIFEGSQKDN